MNAIPFRFSFIFLCILFSGSRSFAQSACANTLKEAGKSFEAGDFSISASLLNRCLKSGFSRDEKVEGYRLLAMDYIYMNESARADSAVKNLLKYNHTYKEFPNVNDPGSLTKLINSYDILPLFTVGLNIGFNYTNVSLTANQSVANTTASYIPLIGYHFGLDFDYAVWQGVHVSAGIQLMDSRYEHDLDSVAGWKQQFSEDLSYVNIPVSARYIFFKHDALFRPYAEAGMSFALLAADNATMFSIDNSTGNTNRVSVSPISRRNRESSSILFGAGLYYKVFGGWLTANVRYLDGLTPVVNKDNRYNDPGFIFNYQYVDDDFKFNKWMFSLGFVLPVNYKVKKIG